VNYLNGCKVAAAGLTMLQQAQKKDKKAQNKQKAA
jgi:hypothetical protein